MDSGEGSGAGERSGCMQAQRHRAPRQHFLLQSVSKPVAGAGRVSHIQTLGRGPSGMDVELTLVFT